jgi:hypothetical protein
LTKDEKLAALARSAAAWKDFPQTGAEYVDSIRGAFNERLRELGLEWNSSIRAWRWTACTAPASCETHQPAG